MSRYLVKTVEQYRVDSETEAKNLIAEAKADKRFTTNKYVSEYKEVKQKGEVVDSFYRVTLTKTFTSEKEPDSTVEVNYTIEEGAFPSYAETEDEEE